VAFSSYLAKSTVVEIQTAGGGGGGCCGFGGTCSCLPCHVNHAATYPHPHPHPHTTYTQAECLPWQDWVFGSKAAQAAELASFLWWCSTAPEGGGVITDSMRGYR